MLEGMADEEWDPVMDPCPGGCCVSLSKNNAG
jgi:uncharacterized cysteine cluster protein YcgN (CxxCxxCC family)